jgi:hypothetical protein
LPFESHAASFDVPMVLTQDTKLSSVMLGQPVTSGAAVEGSQHSRGAVAADFDGDLHVDLFVANSGTPNQLLMNDGTGGFVARTSGAAVEGSQNSFGAVAADFDGDLHVDLFVVNQGDPINGTKVRKMRSWPRSWANFSLQQL